MHVYKTLLLFILVFSTSSVFAQQPSREPGYEEVRERLRADLEGLAAEKASRTDAQKKITSRLLVPIRGARGEIDARSLPKKWRDEADDMRAGRKDVADLVVVEIKGNITQSLLSIIQKNGGVVRAKSVKYGMLSAEISLESLEVIAASPDVRSISESVEAIPQKQSTSAGDVAHQGPTARTTYGITGDGVKVGVISDSVDYLAATQATGDLPSVTVLADYTEGETGSIGRKGEGTAMLEIVHDLAPDAELLFHTGFPSRTDIVSAIEALVGAGAKVIVDDLFFSSEFPFQDDVIARAAEDAIASGVHYFTSAANYGNRNDLTASGYEADYNPSVTALTEPGVGTWPDIHVFPNNELSNQVGANGRACLFWSDPLGEASNDYDLLVYDSTLTTLLGGSFGTQNGTQDAGECTTVETGQRLVIARYSGQSRYLHLSLAGDSQPGLNWATEGFVRGQGGAANVFAVAATSAQNRTTAFDGSESVETFSSDGYRRVFFTRDGTPITSGNFSSTGGEVRIKPDITAADGIATQVPGFNPFFGTSAAAPHAAAIGALLLEANPSLTRAEMLAAFTNGALDIEAPGTDRDSGVGIITATGALSYVLPNYSVTASASPSSSGSVACSPTSVIKGQTTSCTVTPNSGYQIAEVTGTCGGSLSGNTYTTNSITAACTVQASFSQITHAVTPSAGAGGSISPAIVQTVAEGSTTSFTVAADSSGWVASVGGTCGGSLSGNTYTTNTISAACTVEASFSQTTYTVTPSAGANGSISPASAQTVASGSTTTFTLTPATGYEVASVGGTCGGLLSGSTYVTNAINGSCTVQASFSQSSYTVTPSAGAGGSISPATAQTITSGNTTSFTLTPASGYEIASVGGTCGGALSGNTYTTNAITEACTVDASFSQITYAVTPSAGAGGSISPGTAQEIAQGSTTTFTVRANDGYDVASVGGTCGGSLSGNTYTTNAINAACTVDASFSQITHAVTPTAGEGGSISPSTAQMIAEGSTTTFT
ncbi:S8 family serine peptidase, partial [Luminiphilus sp.]|nr:S8 family serine peptidase [Luminiphilus sp.]